MSRPIDVLPVRILLALLMAGVASTAAARSTAATSSVLSGRTTHCAVPVKRPVQSVS